MSPLIRSCGARFILARIKKATESIFANGTASTGVVEGLAGKAIFHRSWYDTMTDLRYYLQAVRGAAQLALSNPGTQTFFLLLHTDRRVATCVWCCEHKFMLYEGTSRFFSVFCSPENNTYSRWGGKKKDSPFSHTQNKKSHKKDNRRNTRSKGSFGCDAEFGGLPF